MGDRGPIGKRAEDRMGHRSRAELAQVKAVVLDAPEPVAQAGDDDWHPIAKRWYDSLKESGQRRWYEPSDWAVAYLIAESISRDLSPQFVGFAQSGRDETTAEYATIPLKGASLSAYLKAMGNLLTTEGDRRRASIELHRATAVDADHESSVTAMADYRAALEA